MLDDESKRVYLYRLLLEKIQGTLLIVLKLIIPMKIRKLLS